MFRDYYAGLILVGYGRNQRFLVGGFHPKPMVTPVHRFQSIESVANNGLRHSRAPPAGYHSVLRTTHCQPPIHYNVRQQQHHQNQTGRLQEMPSSIVQTPAPNSVKAPTAWGLISKCLGVISAIGMVLCRYYFHGASFVYAMCVLIGIAVVIGALARILTHSQSEASGDAGGIRIIQSSSAAASSSSRNEHRNSNHQHLEVVDERSGGGSGGGEVPSLILSPMQCSDTELPPPPYHIAIMLPSQNERSGDEIAKDSPPPSYEKAVT